MRVLLTDKLITDFKAPSKPVTLSDLKSDNLSLIVRPSGTKTFIWLGRVQGKLVKKRLGDFGIHKLKDARDWADELTRQRDLGIEPEAKKATVEEVWKSYLARHLSSKKSRKTVEATVNRDVLPIIGERVFAEVTRKELAAVVNAKLATFPGTSNKVHAHVSALWRWATSTGIDISDTEINVYAGMKKPSGTNSRDRYLDHSEIKALWLATERLDGRERGLYRLLLLTGARRSEIAWLERRHVDLTNRQIIITPERSKNGYELRIPLNDLAMIEAKKLMATGSNSKWLFPAQGNGDADTAITNFTVMHARVLAASGTSDWVRHDLRRTFTTLMAEIGVEQIVVESMTNHVSGMLSGIAGVYNRFKYVDEQRDAARRYGEFIAALVAGQSTP